MERRLWWLGSTGAGREHRGQLPGHHAGLRNDLQDHARVKIRWHDVWLGAAVTALCSRLGVFIGLRRQKRNCFGLCSAGSLIIILVWVYYSAQIFLLGAEFTWVYARTHGSMRNLEATTKPRNRASGKFHRAAKTTRRPVLPSPIALTHESATPRPMWVTVGAGARFY